ncbi:phosphoribosylformylglycinamidine synthase subunit PurS [bacterium]|nr:phosphoribosylformylglycinamidine synthase subunit PurS [bacterium]OQX88509.1 MAG: hypothetical protein B6D65_05890 [candidate division Zixibacteria bacterium 4484_93]RKZ32970.1 MAG: phosphoribosylformylglycinamidine synthase [bacterium]
MPEFTVKVYVRRKEGVLDPEGNTIAGAIASIGYKGISSVRTGKIFIIRLEAPSADSARKDMEKVADKLLSNPIIEDYTVTVEQV